MMEPEKYLKRVKDKQEFQQRCQEKVGQVTSCGGNV